jgi:S-adenosylmethionine decarboxylase
MEEIMHLIIDGYGSDPHVLQDEEFLHQLLDSYPSMIGMTKISDPIVFKYVGNKPEEWGISGFVIIAESHISFHTFVERCYVNIDIFSCRDFDTDEAIRHFKEQLKLTTYKSYLVNRDWNITDTAELNKITLLHQV